jgi:integrase/recombinase XerD
MASRSSVCLAIKVFGKRICRQTFLDTTEDPMTPLRSEFVSSMRLRNYSPKTIKQYSLSVARFAKHFGKCPKLLGPKEIGIYLLYLIDAKKSWSQYRQTVCGLRFLYTKVLGHEWMAEHIPFPRRERPLPQYLTPEEASKVFSVVENPKHKMMLELIYATGLRCGELVRLKLSDIDSKRNVIVVRDGKGNKERLTLLGETLLLKLRNYYRQYRPKEWLFEGRGGHAKEAVPQKACNRAEELSGIGKRVTPHCLRHSFATVLLEQNVDLVTISNLLGHSRIKTTELYTHVTLKKIQQTPKPLDAL